MFDRLWTVKYLVLCHKVVISRDKSTEYYSVRDCAEYKFYILQSCSSGCLVWIPIYGGINHWGPQLETISTARPGGPLVAQSPADDALQGQLASYCTTDVDQRLESSDQGLDQRRCTIGPTLNLPPIVQLADMKHQRPLETTIRSSHQFAYYTLGHKEVS